MCDLVDACPSDPDESQADTDRDGLGDACDPCPGGPDRDADTVEDTCDNCPDAENQIQSDADGDGIGDVCDPCHGTGLFGARQVIQEQLFSPGSIVLEDLDGDEDLDLVEVSHRIGGDGVGNVAWYENVDGTFGTVQSIRSDPGLDGWHLVTADLDGDGDADIASDYGGGVAWIANLGAGSFDVPRPIAPCDAGYPAILAADIDLDGDVDVLAGGLLYENAGGGAFGSGREVLSLLPDRTDSLEAADLDRDGDLDVIAADEATGTVVWYENRGAMTFGPPLTVGSDAPYDSAIAVDLDADGDLDIAAGGQRTIRYSTGPGYSNTYGSSSSTYDILWLAWFENLGAAELFSPAREISSTAYTTSIVAADMDGDNDVDLVVPSVAWYENDGVAHFGRKGVDEVEGPEFVGGFMTVNCTDEYGSSDDSPFSGRDAAVGDLDGDGDLDIVVATESPPRIVWYENQSHCDGG